MYTTIGSQSPERPIKVGILHSLAGAWAIGEVALKDAELLAIAEINQAGGVLGRAIEPIVEDGASDLTIFKAKTRKLILEDQVATIFGCWFSTVRKSVLPILEQFNALLWYPVQYEGLECSKNIFYTGVCPNQQIEPAVEWLLKHRGNRFYLVGSDIVFSRTAHKIIKAKLKRQGGIVLGEDYIAVGDQSFKATIARIKQTQPDVVFSTVNTDSNLGFYSQYKEAGIRAEDIPILAVSVTEEEIRQIGGDVAAGHYAAHNYFQSLDNPANRTFVKNFQTMYGADRVTCDSVEAAYTQVYLWKQAVEHAQSFEVDRVRVAAYGQTLDTPSGIIQVEQNRHLWKTCRIGKILPNGQFEIVSTEDKLFKPQPWLGVDDVEFNTSELVMDMLAEAAQAIQYSCELEQKSRELMEANNRLQVLAQRVELLKRNLSSQIRRSLDLNTILGTAVREIQQVLQVDRCKFLWYQREQDAIAFQSHDSNTPDLTNAGDHDLIQHIKLNGKTILTLNLLQIDDVLTDPRLDAASRELLRDSHLTALLAVSIHTHSGRIGVITCDHRSNARFWSDYEVELLQDVADQLAIAVDQAELYAQAQTTALNAQTQAEQLQQALHDLQTTQAQLVQTEKMSSLGQLVAGLAHEINNPVNFIYGNLNPTCDYTQDLLRLVQLYQQHYPDPVPEIQAEIEAIDLEFLVKDFPRLLSSMKVGADRIRQIILSLRNFSRLDEAEMKLVDIHEGIDSTLLILQHRLKEEVKYPGIEIIKEYGDLPLVECYPGQINQVFMNILSNAIDALEEYSSELAQKEQCKHPATIRICTKTTDSDWITIHISDNGPGISADIQQQLFDPFFTTKPVGKGTGLGLAISHQIVVDKHNGRLCCLSKLGQGTEFVIKIPAEQKAYS
ncbi:transporter substrate-binding protein [Phormidium tenue FACHB-886]|nr:transporter substrate-binding protein [Phormidium tenue FACHB-886]